MTSVDESQIHVTLRGQGSPILGLAGFGCSHWVFDHWTERLQQHHQLILPDNRGMGQSDKVDSAYEIHDLATDASKVLERLDSDPAIVIGISMGGFIAQSLALLAPNRVRALVLMCTLGSGPDFTSLPDSSRDDIQKYYQLDPLVRAKQAMATTTHPSFASIEPELYARVLSDRVKNSADWRQVTHQYDAVQHFLKHAQPIHEIKCPCLILTGDQDRLVDPINAHLLAQKIPSSRVVAIPDTDHLFFLEKPDATVAAIESFIESLP